MSERKRRITSHDVARAAGVSQSVVSRAFTKGASVAPETRRTVLRVARELGYQPNAFARGLVQRRSGLVGVLMARVDNHVYPRVLEEFASKLRATGRQVLFFTDDADSSVEETLRIALQYRVEAMILASVTLSSRTARVLSENGVRPILFNRTVSESAVATVACDNVGAGRLVADALLAGGHRRFAFVGGQPQSSTNRDRRAGFAERLRERGAAAPRTLERSYDYAWGRRAAGELFAGEDAPDAVFCASDAIAFGLLDGARHDAGLRVPDDVAVVGFDDTAVAAWSSFDLSSVRQPVAAMIDATLELVVAPEGSEGRAVLLPATLVERGSTRCRASEGER